MSELSQKGINEYEIDVATGQATYKSVDAVFKTASQVYLVVASTFDKTRLREAIANISLPFLDFLNEIAEAGVVKYGIKIGEKKVIYIGEGDERVEEQLKI